MACREGVCLVELVRVKERARVLGLLARAKRGVAQRPRLLWPSAAAVAAVLYNLATERGTTREDARARPGGETTRTHTHTRAFLNPTQNHS